MALQVWLPLKGDLNNYGLSNITVTNSGAIVDNNGKIGKCYKVTNSTKFTIATQQWMAINGSNSLSISMWIKYQGSSTYVIACNSYEIYFNSSTLGWRLGNGSGHTLNAYIIGTYAENTWYHLTCTWNCTNKILSTYINGSLMKSVVDTSTSAYNSIGSVLSFSYSNTYYLNDLRIYDHCLSPKEVKEISQGLVLHYKLDDPYIENTTNLVINSETFTGFGSYTNGYTSIVDSELGGKKLVITNKTSWCGAYIDVILPATGTYTLSAWCKPIARSSSSVNQTVYCSGGGLSDKNSPVSWNNLGEWQRVSLTLTFTTTNIRLYLIAYGGSRTDDWVSCEYALPQVEQKDHVTPYVNGTRTTTTIYDSSGYGNNGTIIGSLICNSNTPRYNCGTYFDGNSYIITPSGQLSWSNYEYLTISVWMKPTVSRSGYTGSIGIGHDGNSTCKEFAISNSYSGKANHFVLEMSDGSYTCVDSGYTCPLNEWHHYAVTLNGTVVKMYVDSSLVKTQTISWGTATNHSSPQFQIGVDLPGTDEKYTGYYSDVRIYTTTLSDQDILNLYQVNASIDNGGNIISNEFEEEYTSKQQILKTGIVKIDNFLEINDKLKVLSDGSVFLQILHHNAPASNLFTASNCWLNNDTNLYSALIMLKNTSWLQNLAEYEFLVCEKGTSSGTEHQCRWKQTSNPALSSTLSGYSVISGNSTRSWGLMNKNSYGCFHNGSTWWCCCGSYTYTGSSGGIPGFEDIVTTGYLDLYVKIPNEMIKGNIADFVKLYAKSILTNQLIEK